MSNDNGESFEAFRDHAERDKWTVHHALRQAFEWKQQAERIGAALHAALQSNECLRLVSDALAAVVQRHGLAGELQAALDQYVQTRPTEIRDGLAAIRRGMVKNAELAIQGRQRKAAKGPRPPKQNTVQALAIGAMRVARNDGMTLDGFIESAGNGSLKSVTITATDHRGTERFSVDCDGAAAEKTVARSTLERWWAQAARTN